MGKKEKIIIWVLIILLIFGMFFPLTYHVNSSSTTGPAVLIIYERINWKNQIDYVVPEEDGFRIVTNGEICEDRDPPCDVGFGKN